MAKPLTRSASCRQFRYRKIYFYDTLWKDKSDWDEELTSNELDEFSKFANALTDHVSTSIERSLYLNNANKNSAKNEVHVF